MSGAGDYRRILQNGLENRLGSELAFRLWLEEREIVEFTPVREEVLGLEFLEAAGSFGRGTQWPSAGEILASLKEDGVDWSQAIHGRLDQAESEWPSVAESHRALLDRINRVWE